MVKSIRQWIGGNVETSVFLAYLLFTLVCFFPLFCGTASLNWDASDLWLPWKHFITEEFQNGQLPLWNPYHVSGFPQQGDSMTWYPLSWIFGFLNGHYNLSALNQEYLFHIFIAGLGFYHFSGNFVQSRKIRFLLGLSYMFSGFMIGNAQHVSWIISAAWLPFVFHYLLQILRQQDNKAIFKLALTGFLFFSGGYLAIFFVALYIIVISLGIYFFRKRATPAARKAFLYLGFSFVLIFLLALPLLLSAWNIFPLFNRFDPSDPNFNVHTGSTPLNGVLAILLPLVSGIYNITEIEFGSFSAYLGLVPVLFLCFAIRQFRQPKIYVPVLLALFFLLCSLGDLLPLRALIAKLPLLDLFRYPTLFRLFFIFFLLIAAGVAAENLPPFPERKTHRVVGGILVLLFAAGLLFCWPKADFGSIAAYFKYFSLHNPLENLQLYDRVLLNLIILLAGTVILLLSPRKKLKQLLFLTWGAEIFGVALTGAPHTVYHPVNVSYANELIDYQPQHYPQLIPSHAENEKNGWQGYLYFSWQGKTMFLKQWSKHWYNPLKLKKPADPVKGLSETEAENLPLFMLVSFDGKTLVYPDSINRKIRTEIKNNTDIRLELPDFKLQAGRNFLLVKQQLARGWEAKVNGSACRLSETPQGFMLIPITAGSKHIRLAYDTANYWSVFQIFLGVFLLLLLIISWRSEHRGLISLALGTLLVVIVWNNKERWSKAERISSSKNSLLIDYRTLNKNEQFRSLAFWKKSPATLFLEQDYPKKDADIAYFRYFYPEKEGYVQIKGRRFARYGKGKPQRELLYSTQDTVIGSNFLLDVRSLVRRRPKPLHKLLCLKIVYEAPNATELNCWLAQLRETKWVDGEAIPLKTPDSLKNEERKIIVRYFDLTRFHLLPDDELRFYAWCADASAQAKIHRLELSLE